jgi:hypothetical protein
LHGAQSAEEIMMMMLSRERSSACYFVCAVIAVGDLAGTPRAAHADDDDVVGDDESRPSALSRRVEAGAFLSSTLSPRNEGHGLVTVMAGWNQARGGGTYDTAAEAQIRGPVSLLAGATYDGPGTIASPHFELRLDALHQATFGLDVAVAAGYSAAGFNTVPAAVLKVAFGRTVGATYLLANVVYEHGLQDGERAGELRLAALYPVSQAAHVGIDSRFQVDLERDNNEPAGETDWEWRSGPVATYTWNQIVFMGGAGISALRLRGGASTAVGPVLTAGFGTMF